MIENYGKVYVSIRELIVFLKEKHHHREVAILEHRFYKVAWTSGAELIEEIASVLVNIQQEMESVIDDESAEKIRQTLQVIEESVGR